MTELLSSARPAIFLDRDGTLNKDTHYLYKKEDWQWLPHVPETLLAFAQAGYVLIVITNQSGIARGYYTDACIHALHTWVNTCLQRYGCHIEAFYYCPHHPDFSASCSCRKPSPTLLFQAAREFNIDLGHSWMIGDKISDVQAGKAAGCRTVLLCTNSALQEKKYALEADYCMSDLAQAAQYILLDR